MLIDIGKDKVIDTVPFPSEFDALCKRLSEAEFDAMVTRVNELIDEAGSEIATAGWLPGSDWTGTPFEPIYTEGGARRFRRLREVLRTTRLVRRHVPAGGLGVGPVSGRRQGHQQSHLLPAAEHVGTRRQPEMRPSGRQSQVTTEQFLEKPPPRRLPSMRVVPIKTRRGGNLQ